MLMLMLTSFSPRPYQVELYVELSRRYTFYLIQRQPTFYAHLLLQIRPLYLTVYFNLNTNLNLNFNLEFILNLNPTLELVVELILVPGEIVEKL